MRSKGLSLREQELKRKNVGLLRLLEDEQKKSAQLERMNTVLSEDFIRLSKMKVDTVISAVLKELRH